MRGRIGQHPLRILPVQDSYESPQGGGNDIAAHPPVLHAWDNIVDKDVGPDGGRARPHRLLDSGIGVPIEGLSADASQDDPFFVEHDAHVLVCCPHLVPYVAEAVG